MASEKKKDPKFVNPVLAWSLFGGELVIVVILALIFWL